MKKRKLTPAQTIILSFLGAIVLGTLILMLPVCSAGHTWTSPLTAAFTSVTSVCVTGLTVVDTYSYWSTPGQVVILILVQVGGLGFITIVSGFLHMFRRRITLSVRMMLEEAFNLDSMEGFLGFLKLVLIGTGLVEGIGFIACLPIFVLEYGAHGIWISLFHSVSSFCNAGLDIIGSDSLQKYAVNIPLNIITMLLIVIGGIGFIVWQDIIAAMKKIKAGEIRIKNIWQNMSLHTKIVLKATLVLILGGALLFCIFEWNNPDTVGSLSVGDKILACLFQSVTTRTAGFAALPQGSFTGPSVFLNILLMLIGGSPIGTAGGIKTVTIVLIIFLTRSIIKGQSGTVIGRRQIEQETVKKAVAIASIAIMIFFFASVLLYLVQGGTFSKACFHIMSALGTVGLSMEGLGGYGIAAKLILMICMFFGRIGPLALVVAIMPKDGEESERYPKRKVTLG